MFTSGLIGISEIEENYIYNVFDLGPNLGPNLDPNLDPDLDPNLGPNLDPDLDQLNKIKIDF